MKITLTNIIQIEDFNETDFLSSFIKKRLTFSNLEYFQRKKMGKSLWGLKSHFSFYRFTENKVLLPRGFIHELQTKLESEKVSYDFYDKRSRPSRVIFQSEIFLTKQQQEAFQKTAEHDNGIIVAPPGSGKTIIALEIIKEKSLPALILVHRRQILEQWIEKIINFLRIPKKEIGTISTKKIDVGDKVTVSTLQSLSKIRSPKLKNLFGTVFVDECHHVPAKTFRNAVSKLNPCYLYGLTATPYRKNNDERSIFVFIGDVIHDESKNSTASPSNTSSKIIIKTVETDLHVPFNVMTGDINLLNKILFFDTSRNKTIINNIKNEIEKEKKIILITERKEHIDVLNLYLSGRYDTISITGDDSAKSRKTKNEKMASNDYQLIMTTGQFFGEGSDVLSLDCLFLVFPLSFDGKLMQYIGRILRGAGDKTVYDFRDYKIDYFERQYAKREKFYKKMQILLKRPVLLETERARDSVILQQ
ncbi:DEAD/DEAH box helicase [candidate division WOR-3 bacterium]|nr:DEAD/DEAH box helicase [candidate division WOR-3 bacterium]